MKEGGFGHGEWTIGVLSYKGALRRKSQGGGGQRGHKGERTGTGKGRVCLEPRIEEDSGDPSEY